jgi:hypothetical protein
MGKYFGRKSRELELVRRARGKKHSHNYIIIVGWNDSVAQISSVSDSNGNLYALAVGPTVLTGSESLSQAIYYAKNIAAASAGSNSLTVNFTKAAVYPDIRILEYSGLDKVSPLDVVVDAAGNSTSSSSGAVITQNAADLLVGANVVNRLGRPRQRMDSTHPHEPPHTHACPDSHPCPGRSEPTSKATMRCLRLSSPL